MVRNSVFFVQFSIWFTVTVHVSVSGQMVWTPIYIDGNSQIDLWTQASKGCVCPWDEEGSASGRKDCACCVQDGGCHCGQEAPNRCAQCGLEHYCSSMCNLTIDSNTLLTKSGKTFGQIKSPSIEGPSSCWYTFRPGYNQRVELQFYRLVNVGRFNGNSCESGFLEWQANDNESNATSPIQICGANERYSPPVVMYSDNSNTSTLIFQINEKTLRSQFLAYFSFTLKANIQVGFRPKGGSRILNTNCDWIYNETSCITTSDNSTKGCILASPNYPGMYPPNQNCKYNINSSSSNTRVRIVFTAVLLPHNHCSTDYIAVYEGDQLLKRVCNNQQPTIESLGPSILVEFSSGAQVPPYNYNGFVAKLEFLLEKPSEATFSSIELGSGRSTNSEQVLYENIVVSTLATLGVAMPNPACEILVFGNSSRSGRFDTRDKEGHTYCRIVFRGSPTDVVHVSLFNYRLKVSNCRSSIEIYNGLAEEGSNPIKRFCSPTTKARGSQTFISTENVMSISLKRSVVAIEDPDYIEGAYLFHDEQIAGTLQTYKMCDVHYYGMSSPSVGTIDNPVNEHIFKNVNGQLKCVQQFEPADNQSVTITIRTLGEMKGESGTHCQTQCGDNGCQCVTDMIPLDQVDHLLLAAENGPSLTCLCGNFQAEWLPVIVRSWSSILVTYSVAQYSWAAKGYDFSAVYAFVNDGECGHHTFTSMNGEINSKNLTSTGHFNNYFYESCTWKLESHIQRQLILDVTSNQNRPCTAWNITIFGYSSTPSSDQGNGELLYTFCPRDKQKTYSLPWRLTTAVVKLRALTRKQPNFSLRWRSLMARPNTRLGSPTPAPNAVSPASTSSISHLNQITFLLVFLIEIRAIL